MPHLIHLDRGCDRMSGNHRQEHEPFVFLNGTCRVRGGPSVLTGKSASEREFLTAVIN